MNDTGSVVGLGIAGIEQKVAIIFFSLSIDGID
jgi:hypothetical protein